MLRLSASEFKGMSAEEVDAGAVLKYDSSWLWRVCESVY